MSYKDMIIYSPDSEVTTTQEDSAHGVSNNQGQSRLHNEPVSRPSNKTNMAPPLNPVTDRKHWKLGHRSLSSDVMNFHDSDVTKRRAMYSSAASWRERTMMSPVSDVTNNPHVTLGQGSTPEVSVRGASIQRSQSFFLPNAGGGTRNSTLMSRSGNQLLFNKNRDLRRK